MQAHAVGAADQVDDHAQQRVTFQDRHAENGPDRLDVPCALGILGFDPYVGNVNRAALKYCTPEDRAMIRLR